MVHPSVTWDPERPNPRDLPKDHVARDRFMADFVAYIKRQLAACRPTDSFLEDDP